MGQGSSQPQNGELPELEGHGKDPVVVLFSSNIALLEILRTPVTVVKKGKSGVQVEGTPAPKRKRKSSLNNTGDSKPFAVPTKPQLSPQNPADSHPSKRTKVTSSTTTSKDARKSEKKSAQGATTSSQIPNGVKPTEYENKSPQTMNAQSPESTAHFNGTSKKSKKSKAKSTRENEEEENLAHSLTLPESEPLVKAPASADLSAMDTSSDQKDSMDTTGARGPRPGKKEKLVGFFAPAEVRALEAFKLDFCTKHALSSHSFDRMVQHVDRRKDSGWPCDEAITSKAEFWQAIYDVLPGRDRRSVYRFMRRHFQDSSQKPHHWTHEQDEELITMVSQYGPKFAHIAKMLGRGEDDVVQRWKNRLEHRSTMRRGAWSEEEVRGLLDALQSAWVALKKDGKDVGQDIYEMDEGLISWGQVSNKLDNWRSRQQCADKWRKIRRKIMGLRSSGVEGAVFDPASEARPQGRAKSVTLAEQMEMERVYKSAEYVNSDDGNESEADSPGANKSTAPKKAQKENTSTELAGVKTHSLPVLPKPVAVPEKASEDDSSPESESEATSESGTGSSDDGSESEAGSPSVSGSSAGSNSNDEINGKVDPRIIAQDTKLKSKGVKDHPGSFSKVSSQVSANEKPSLQNTPSKKINPAVQPKSIDKQAAKSIETLKAKDQPKSISQAQAPEQQKPSGQKKKVQHETPESETGSSSDSPSDSDSDSSAESNSGSASDPEEFPIQGSFKASAKNGPAKASTSTQKATEKIKNPKRSENDRRNTKSSSGTSSASSEAGSTEDSAESGDQTDESDVEGSVDEPIESPKIAPAQVSKRKILSTAQAPEKRDTKRLKTDSKISRNSSSPSSPSGTPSSEDSESKGDSEDSASQKSDTSSSASDGSESESESESVLKLEPESKSSVDPKVRPHIAQSKQKLVNGQKPLPASATKERSNSKNGKGSAPKAKAKPAQISSPLVKDGGLKTKDKLRLVPAAKKKASK
ncbi:MYB DNA-binding domain protein [Aspergillus clavatus NRRL 1]|uniref:MYB DNA-binding domain protein n=1 Tax=Aspergillus clavatus (strain ATCC 1007 / CBS 513.65 / DSM 816 / NCTC 3887 / NRRL 1 / QM 1276 / 107) TaxID=344612 RepID=A1CFA0_ASPCL|nr:MYB DNA-binding domain protein [Aspergillus clavatus NRRL 1]EAW11549.1 MYB DNA-binding domain protein [Aspergillus clavatus NRRL 1]